MRIECLAVTVGIASLHPVSADPRPTNPGITPNTLVLVPYQATGYRFFSLEEDEDVPADFAQPDFDDSGFPPGQAGFGSEGDCPLQQQVSTEWMVNSRLLIRRTVSVPESATNVRIMLSVDNDVTHAYFNGHLIASNIRHEDCPILDEFRIDVDPSLVGEDNVIAFELLDRGVESFFDMRVLVDLPTPPIDETESLVVLALQSPSAPVYDRNGMLCKDVPAIPPPHPSCKGHLSCPTRDTPPAQCDLVSVTCPDFTCPTTQQPSTDPRPPPAYTNTRPRIPLDPLGECEWPVITLSAGPSGDELQSSGGEFGVRMNAVSQKTGLSETQWRVPSFADDAPVGCFPPSIAGPPEPLPDDVAAAGLPAGAWKAMNAAEKDFAKRHPFVAVDFWLDSQIAKIETQRRWRDEPFRNDNGPENAFQHAFWNALMTWGHGRALAKEAADAHENFPGNQRCEQNMDLHNNEIGRQIGASTSLWENADAVANAVHYPCIMQNARCIWIAGPGATPCPPLLVPGSPAAGVPGR